MGKSVTVGVSEQLGNDKERQTLNESSEHFQSLTFSVSSPQTACPCLVKNEPEEQLGGCNREVKDEPMTETLNWP